MGSQRHRVPGRFWERSGIRNDTLALLDLLPLAVHHRNTVESGGEFKIKAGSGRGFWVGTCTCVNDKPVLAIRTYVDSSVPPQIK